MDGEFMQDWYFSLHPFSDVLKFDGVFSLKMHNRSIDSIRISERMVSTLPGLLKHEFDPKRERRPC